MLDSAPRSGVREFTVVTSPQPQLPATPTVWRTPVIVAVAVVVSLGSIALGLLVGYGDLGDADLRDTILRLRAYRVATAFGVGASLAVGGVLVQALFRNPLASPSILGVSAGASLGGQTAMLAFQASAGLGLASTLVPEMLLPFGCLAGALAALGLLVVITRNRPDPIVLLLCGFLLSTIFMSVGALVTTLGQETWELGRAMIAFTLGGVSGAGPRQVLLITGIAIIGITAAWSWARPLDLMLAGLEEAQSLGVDTRVVRRWCVVWTALLSAGAVAVGGNIAFVGLVVPHAMRTVVGLGNRRLVPAAALAGGVFLVLCDVLARLAPTYGELPLSVVTGLIGGPMFLVMLLRSRYRGVTRG